MYRKLMPERQKAYRILYRSICEERERAELPLHNVEEVQAVIRALRYDFPELIYVDLSASTDMWIYSDRISLKIPYCFPKEQRQRQQLAFEEKCRKIVAELKKKYDDDFSLEVMICAWIIRNVTYGRAKQGRWNGQTAYEALMLRQAVCHGMSCLFKVLADLAGIEETLIVSGKLYPLDGSEPGLHSWNIVKIRGRYTHIDVTNDGFLMKKADHDPIRYPSGIWINFTDEDAGIRYRWDRNFFPACSAPEVSYCAMQGNFAHTEKELRQIIRRNLKSWNARFDACCGDTIFEGKNQGKVYFTIGLDRKTKWKKNGRELILDIIHDLNRGGTVTVSWLERMMSMTILIE